MPLYELIVIGRCGEAKGTANLFRQVALTVCGKGGNFMIFDFSKGVK